VGNVARRGVLADLLNMKMPTKKIPISFNGKEQAEIQRLISILGVGGYGDIPKAIKFSITYTLEQLEKDTKFIPTIDSDKLELWLSSVKKLKASQDRENYIQKLQKTEFSITEEP